MLFKELHIFKHFWAKVWTQLGSQMQTSKFDCNNGQVTVLLLCFNKWSLLNYKYFIICTTSFRKMLHFWISIFKMYIYLDIQIAVHIYLDIYLVLEDIYIYITSHRSARQFSDYSVCTVSKRSWARIPLGQTFYMELQNLGSK